MTQEYTPTVSDIKSSYIEGSIGDGSVTNQDDDRLESSADFDRWLAAHDAQIRAEAMELTDEESNKLSEVIWNYVEDEDLDAATGEVKSTLEAIAKTRMEQE